MLDLGGRNGNVISQFRAVGRNSLAEVTNAVPHRLNQHTVTGQIARIVVKRTHVGRLVSDKGGAIDVDLCPVCLHLIRLCRNIDSDIRRLVRGEGPQHIVALLDGDSAVVHRGNLATDGRLCSIYFCLRVIIANSIVDPARHALLHAIADVLIEDSHAV